jgi:L-lysine 6-transaminase
VLHNNPVGAIVIEPVHSSTGASVSDAYLNKLSSLAHTHGAALIIDATESGQGATGKNYWGYTAGHPDYVVFGKRAFAEGFYSRPLSKQLSITYGGDMLRLMQFRVLKQVIEQDKLIEKVGKVGNYLKQRVENATKGKQGIAGVAGAGTSLFINTNTLSAAQALHSHLLRSGIVTRLNGSNGVLLKPALILEEKHADVIA